MGKLRDFLACCIPCIRTKLRKKHQRPKKNQVQPLEGPVHVQPSESPVAEEANQNDRELSGQEILSQLKGDGFLSEIDKTQGGVAFSIDKKEFGNECSTPKFPRRLPSLLVRVTPAAAGNSIDNITGRQKAHFVITEKDESTIVLPPIKKSARLEEKRAAVLARRERLVQERRNKVILKHRIGESGTVVEMEGGGTVHFL